MGKIGIRREDALIYERRCPLIPSHVGELVKQGFGRTFPGPGLGPGPTVPVIRTDVEWTIDWFTKSNRKP